MLMSTLLDHAHNEGQMHARCDLVGGALLTNLAESSIMKKNYDKPHLVHGKVIFSCPGVRPYLALPFLGVIKMGQNAHEVTQSSSHAPFPAIGY